ncbi:MAG TPA: DNA polymerase III subunit gamma/tau [Acidimicrobiales bacterium]|nr:MAG: DNA polymerase III, subunit gamma and tau [Actinobacteria bacterium 21-73-9]HQU27386.1 DNA polymerase III subunit gamma/tau [Acidimicrobiales bacterium]
MPDGPVTPTSLEGVTSLYRRFRPGRFCEMRGQEHVVRALRGAVANARVSHAYLFSGPRGTGKTTTARILAKALNCERPVDGDACNECASCVAITKGSSLDVIELDAASNNGVDDVRDIVAGAWHGTPGSWKVYIFDEVHQLSKAASAALLKTLEEPPAHVVFVLATTDPHKVLPTIRSRTQHLEFRLYPAETLASLLRDVSDAADLAADEATVEAAVRLGRGSARDALSALDQLLATGAVAEARPTFDGLLEGVAQSDAVATLTALASLVGEGWDPEQLAESLAGEVRQVFLLQVAPRVADAVDADRARLADWGERLGLARTVRVLETVGRAIREMKSAPDKVVILEVALVRLVRPELDATYEALEERLGRLERELRAAPSPPAPPAPPRRPIGQGAAPVPEAAPSVPFEAALAPAPAPAPAPPAPSDDAEGDPALDDVRTRFAERVVPRTSRAAQLILRSARVEALEGLVLTIAVASEEMRQNTEMISQGLRGALEHEFKRGFTLHWTVDASLAAAAPPAPAPRRAPAPMRDEEVHDTGDDDAEVVVVDSAAEHLITEMFPGAEEIS